MPLRVECVHCGKHFSAWEDLVGKAVQCPKCNQKMTLGAAPASTPARQTSSPSPPPAPAGGALPQRPAAKRPRAPSPPQPDTPAPAAQRPSRSPGSLPAPPAGDDDFDDDDALPFACPNCEQPMPPQDDLCDHCGYHRILKKVIDMDGVRRPDTSTGFERVIRRQLHEHETTENTLLWIKIVAGFFLAVLLLGCLGIWGLLLGLLAGGGAWYYLQHRGAAQEQAGVNRDPVSKLVWNVALLVQRTVGWRAREWPFPRCRVLVLRDPRLNDQDVSELENLKDFQAIDLEGTQVSDAGLVYLEDLAGLQYLVLRGTRVTAAGVQRLQQHLPNAWIWA